MPEGHTIHRIASRHQEVFAGAPVRASSPQGRFGTGAAQLDGRVLQAVEAYGKHLLYYWEGRRTLHVHLGLVGKFRTHRPANAEPTPATRLVLANDDAAAYLTGPMTCELVDGPAVESIIGRLGPDPLRSRVPLREFAGRASVTRRPIGEVLLDQQVIAGIGNVYRAEILFLCGIHPRRAASDLTPGEVATVWKVARDELRKGLGDGRIITVRPRDVGASRRDRLPERLQRYVYKREHKPCLRCRTTIATAEMAGRRTWWCPTCQPGDTFES